MSNQAGPWAYSMERDGVWYAFSHFRYTSTYSRPDPPIRTAIYIGGYDGRDQAEAEGRRRWAGMGGR